MKYEPSLFDNYTLLEHADTNEYNLQAAEVDANAYAALFCEKHFGMTPLLDGYSDEVKQAINARKMLI